MRRLAFGPALLVAVASAAQEQQPAQPPPPKLLPKVYQPLSPDQEKKLSADRERFGLPPVESEPEMPSLEEADKRGFMALPGNGYLWRDPKGTRVVVPGMVGLSSGMMEVFATLGPKDHEAVLKIICDIHVLDMSLSTILRAKRGDYPQLYGEPDKTDTGRLLVFVQWKDSAGKRVQYRAEDLIIHIKRNTTFPRVGWMYLGGWHESLNPVTKQPQQTLRAALSKLVITTWRDPYSLIDNPLKPEDAANDIIAANMFVLPPPGTPVLVAFRRPTPEELSGIKEIEKKVYSQ